MRRLALSNTTTTTLASYALMPKLNGKTWCRPTMAMQTSIHVQEVISQPHARILHSSIVLKYSPYMWTTKLATLVPLNGRANMASLGMHRCERNNSGQEQRRANGRASWQANSYCWNAITTHQQCRRCRKSQVGRMQSKKKYQSTQPSSW